MVYIEITTDDDFRVKVVQNEGVDFMEHWFEELFISIVGEAINTNN